jgi:acetyl esterase/lipase
MFDALYTVIHGTNLAPWILTGISLLLIAYALWCWFLLLVQDRMIFARHQAPPAGPPPSDAIVLTRPGIDDCEPYAWYFAPPQTSVRADVTVVIFHGNSSTIGCQTMLTQGYRELGVGVLLPEYRGYGNVGGEPSEDVIAEESAWFIREMCQRYERDPRKLVFHGRSLGGGVAGSTGRLIEPAGLILDCTFTSMISLTRLALAPVAFLKHPFRTIEFVRSRAYMPTLVFHARRDEVVPVEEGRAFARAGRHVRYIEYDAGHFDLPRKADEQDFWTRIGEFIDHIHGTRAAKRRKKVARAMPAPIERTNQL